MVRDYVDVQVIAPGFHYPDRSRQEDASPDTEPPFEPPKAPLVLPGLAPGRPGPPRAAGHNYSDMSEE